MTLCFAGSALAAPNALCDKSCQRRAKKITIDVQDAEMQNVVRLFSDVSHLNFVLSDDVKGKVSMRLKNVRWDRALKVILQTKGFIAVREHNIVRIVDAQKHFQEREAKLSLVQSCEEKAPLKVTLIPVNYGVASEMAEQVRITLSKRGTVAVDERTNTLIVREVDCP